MMKILVNATFLMILAIYSKAIFAIALDEVTLVDLSSSEKSFVIDRGQIEKFDDGLYAKFFLQVGDYKFPKMFLISEGRLIKSFPQKSYWYMEKIYLPHLIKKETKLLMLTTKNVTKGRPISQKVKHTVLPAKSVKSIDQSNENNNKPIPEKYIQSLDEYEASDDLFETITTPEADQSINTYETFRKYSGSQFSDDLNEAVDEEYFVGNHKIKLADIKKAEDKKLLDSMASGLVEKINSQKFGLENGLYRDQKKSFGDHEINDRISISSVYDVAKEEEREKHIIDNRVIAKMNRDGEHWSEDMDNETLRRYFIRTGLEREQRRRELVLNELDGHEVHFHYSGSLSDHTSSIDQNYRNLGYELGLSYDLHLSRVSSELKNWSLQLILEKGVSDYDLGGQNGRGEEGSYGGYLNYYFYNNPISLNTLIILGGVGLKAGSLSMSGINLKKDYSYQVLSFPAFQLMGKYRFRSGDLAEDNARIGASFNAGIMFDSKRLSAINSLEDNINGKFSVKDLKYCIGLGFYF